MAGRPKQQSPRAGSAPSESPLALPLVAALGLAAALSLAVPLQFAGTSGAWAVAPIIGEAVARALGLGLALLAALRGWEAIRRSIRSPVLRVTATIAVGLALAVVLRFAAPVSYIGDWQVILTVSDSAEPLGKWYGASLVYAAVRKVLGAAAGVSTLDAVRWTSSLFGAATAFVFVLLAERFGMTRATAAWPFFWLSAFGSVGVGLGHVEIYALVAFSLALFLWLAVVTLESPSIGRLAVLGGWTGIALTLYLGLAPLAAAFVAVLLMVLRNPRQPQGIRARLRGPALALVVAVATAGAILAFGPPAVGIQGPLSEEWTRQFGLTPTRGGTIPWFHPADSTWPLIPALLRPRYWIAPFALASGAQRAWLGDRVGVALLVVLGAVAAARVVRRERMPPAVTIALLVAAGYLALAYTVRHGLPMPYDWDMTAYVSVATTVAAMTLAGWLGAGRPWPRAASWLLGCAGSAALLAGVAFLVRVGEPPKEFGAARAGLRLAIVPPRIELQPGRPVPIQIWLRNEGTAPIVMRKPTVSYLLVAAAPARSLRSTMQLHHLPGTREIPAGETVCFTTFNFLPSRFEIAETVPEGAEPAWQPVTGVGPALTYGGKWIVSLSTRPGEPSMNLLSNPVEVAARP